jgi:hypothetical protein
MHALQNYTRDNLAISLVYGSGQHALTHCGNLWLRQAALARRRATLFAKNVLNSLTENENRRCSLSGPQIPGWAP